MSDENMTETQTETPQEGETHVEDVQMAPETDQPSNDTGTGEQDTTGPVDQDQVDAPVPEEPVDAGTDGLPVQPEEAPVDLGLTGNMPAPSDAVQAVKDALEATGCKVVVDPEYPSFLTVMREKDDMTLSYAVNVHDGLTKDDVLKEVAEAGL